MNIQPIGSIIRDKTPQVLEAVGLRVTTEKSPSNVDIKYALRIKAELDKLVATSEYSETTCRASEVIDLVLGLAKLRGVTKGTINATRIANKATYGSYNQHLVLTGLAQLTKEELLDIEKQAALSASFSSRDLDSTDASVFFQENNVLNSELMPVGGTDTELE